MYHQPECQEYREVMVDLNDSFGSAGGYWKCAEMLGYTLNKSYTITLYIFCGLYSVRDATHFKTTDVAVIGGA